MSWIRDKKETREYNEHRTTIDWILCVTVQYSIISRND